MHCVDVRIQEGEFCRWGIRSSPGTDDKGKEGYEEVGGRAW